MEQEQAYGSSGHSLDSPRFLGLLTTMYSMVKCPEMFVHQPT
jgi:hypothetical protein